MQAVSLTLPDTEKERLMGEEITIENLQKWLNQGSEGLPYAFFALINQMNTNQKMALDLLQKQDIRIEALESCLKDVKPIVQDRKSLAWLKANVLGVISFVTTSINFYLLLKMIASKP